MTPPRQKGGMGALFSVPEFTLSLVRGLARTGRLVLLSCAKVLIGRYTEQLDQGQ